MSKFSNLLPDAAVIRDATNESENTASRIGGLFVSIIQTIIATMPEVHIDGDSIDFKTSENDFIIYMKKKLDDGTDVPITITIPAASTTKAGLFTPALLTELQNSISAETKRAMAAEGNLNVMDGNLNARTNNLEENAFTNTDIQRNSSSQTILLYNNAGGLKKKIPITPATSETAGLMTPAQRADIETLKQATATLGEGLIATNEKVNKIDSGGSVEVPMATNDTAGIVKLGTETIGTAYYNGNSIPITSNALGLRFLYGKGLGVDGGALILELGTSALTKLWKNGKGIPLAMFDDGLGINIDTQYFTNSHDIPGVLGLKLGSSLTVDSDGVTLRLGTEGIYNNNESNNGTVAPFVFGSVVPSDGSAFNKVSSGVFGIPIATNGGLELTRDGLKVSNSTGVTKITWSDSSNMNDYTSAGVYDIYGERTNANDNLPITQAYSGASIAARLIVVASTLQPSNTEKCITQFLYLSNRMGGEGNTYVRTYNENNNGLNGWSEWKKQQGMVESYINTDSVGITITGTTTTGLNGMTENGMYSGIYTDDYTLASPTFVETFVLVVINDYTVSSQAGTPRRISQLKYATDTITGQCTIKKRVGTGDDSISWSDWEDIGGGSSEIDVTDALRTYGLPTLASQGLIKEGVTYVSKFTHDCFPTLDNNGYIHDYLDATYDLGLTSQDVLRIKYIENLTVYGTVAWFEIDAYVKDGDYAFGYDRFIVSDNFNIVKVSSNTIELPNTITFTINGNTYTAEKGMTWGQWLNSTYPSKGIYQNFYVSGNTIVINGGNIQGDDNTTRHLWDVLNDGEVFKASYGGGGNNSAD